MSSRSLLAVDTEPWPVTTVPPRDAAEPAFLPGRRPRGGLLRTGLVAMRWGSPVTQALRMGGDALWKLWTSLDADCSMASFTLRIARSRPPRGSAPRMVLGRITTVGPKSATRR